jgi:hypothetical protein
MLASNLEKGIEVRHILIDVNEFGSYPAGVDQ